MKDVNNKLLDELHVQILNTELRKRKKLDPKYSVRKFAADAGVDNSTMSKYLKGTRQMSPYVFENILKKLKTSNDVEKDYIKQRLNIELLAKKHVEIRTHWYYFAILELTNLVDFKSDAQWIATKLNLDLSTTRKALDLLFDLNALIVDNGKFKDNLGNVTFVESPDMDIRAGRIHQTELLEKSIHSVNNEEAKLKDHTCLSFALDSKLIPDVKELITEFQETLAHLVEEKSIENDTVYTVQVNLTALTTKS